MGYYDDSAYGRFIADGEAEQRREDWLTCLDALRAGAVADGYAEDDWESWVRQEGLDNAADHGVDLGTLCDECPELFEEAPAFA